MTLWSGPWNAERCHLVTSQAELWVWGGGPPTEAGIWGLTDWAISRGVRAFSWRRTSSADRTWRYARTAAWGIISART
ncbi:hypothetical protein ANANG_G00172990 [Anguilla anguilla]|uniref:Uncharacterized protein n=1 Tax=Anguilla anguilla TaxID=7936 RepID=A0A9D3M3S4_ANGAN|nr:hypothetical protein ANANG_G00172990 [Anguilla anguilla]